VELCVAVACKKMQVGVARNEQHAGQSRVAGAAGAGSTGWCRKRLNSTVLESQAVWHEQASYWQYWQQISDSKGLSQQCLWIAGGLVAVAVAQVDHQPINDGPEM
jgi:hypothetical protein